MDEAEAEAVLLVLGQALKWNDILNSSFSTSMNQGVTEERYAVKYLSTKGGFQSCWRRTPQDVVFSVYRSTLASTRDAAKAACERHHATGRWD